MSIRRLVQLLIALAVLATAASAAVIYFGLYNVAATEQHTAPVYWLLNTSLKQAAEQRAKDIVLPALDDKQRIERGFDLYREHCVNCHGAPGVAPDAFALGMTPVPANLALTAKHWPAKRMYWVVRYGIKMTGMPAWEFRLREEELWDLVAFLMTLPNISPLDYAAGVRNAATRQGPLKPMQTQARKDAVTSEPAAMHGDAARGKFALQQYACVTCHEIPGVVGAIHPVGPPLEGMAMRGFIGGVLPNTRQNMVRWLRDPQAVDARTAMPNLGVTERDAHDLAAFLETLK